ncbi:MAG: hypothetical protein ACOYCB_13120 [Fastidiosipilaceae bacterium]|jgi:hypothetical protein
MLKQKVALHNRFDFEIYDVETGETEYAQAENIILDNFWPQLGSSWFRLIEVGSGNGTLDATRNALFASLGYKSATLMESVYDTDNTCHITKSATFGTADANGTWTEVGIGSGNGLVTHAFITDSTGKQISIDKTNTKIITVYATVFGEVLGNTTFKGELNVILRLFLELWNLTGGRYYFSTLKTAAGGASVLAAHALVNITGGWSRNGKVFTAPQGTLPIGSGNHPIRAIAVSATDAIGRGVGGASLPNALFSGFNYTGISIGTGNGNETGFDFPMSYIVEESESIYINDVKQTRGIDYTINYGLRSVDTTITGPYGCIYPTPSGISEFEEIIELPTPLADVTSVSVQNGSQSARNYNMCKISLSKDLTNWIVAGEASPWAKYDILVANNFVADKYKYVKVEMTRATTGYDGTIYDFTIYATSPGKSIVFTTPPGAGAVITADFSINYINKTDNYKLDVQGEIQFGEPEEEEE